MRAKVLRGIGVELRVTCVLVGCAQKCMYSPIVVWVERRVFVWEAGFLVGDLYEKEKRGNLYGGRRLGSLFTMESDCGQEPGCVKGGCLVRGGLGGRTPSTYGVCGQWVYCTERYLPRVQEREGTPRIQAIIVVWVQGGRGVSCQCQLPTIQTGRRGSTVDTYNSHGVHLSCSRLDSPLRCLRLRRRSIWGDRPTQATPLSSELEAPEAPQALAAAPSTPSSASRQPSVNY